MQKMGENGMELTNKDFQKPSGLWMKGQVLPRKDSLSHPWGGKERISQTGEDPGMERGGIPYGQSPGPCDFGAAGAVQWSQSTAGHKSS